MVIRLGISILRVLALIALITLGAPVPGWAQFVSAPQWQSTIWQRGSATLDLDFVNDQFYLNGTTYSGTAGNCTTLAANLSSNCASAFITGAGATFTRANTTSVTSSGAPFYTDSTQGQSWVSRADSTAVATYFDSSGILQTATTGAARSSTYYYNGNSWVANSGTLVEPAATNSIRNNTMTGAAAGGTVTPQTISSIVASGTTATVTTAAPHGVASGSIITVSGASPSNFNGTFGVASVTSNTFTYNMLSAPGGNATIVGSYTATSAGTYPTYWDNGWGNGTGVGIQIVGTGVENGVNYIEYHVQGVSSGATLIWSTLEGFTQVSAAVGQTWTSAYYIRLTGGDFTNVSCMNMYFKEINSGGGTVQEDYPSCFTPTSAPLGTTRYTLTKTLSNPAVAYVSPNIIFYPSGGAVNFTFRLGMPQLENSSSATSVIATSSAAITRAADVYSVPRGGTYYDNYGTLRTAPVSTSRIDYGVPTASELTSNSSGTFYGCSGSTCSGWTNGTGTISFSSGQAALTAVGGNAAKIYQAVTTTAGRKYGVTVNVAAGNAVTVSVGTSAGDNSLLSGTAAPGKTTSLSFTATGTTTYVQVSNSATIPTLINSVSVKALTINPQGILIEESRTNKLQNNMAIGVVATDGVERATNGTLSGCSGSSCTGWGATVNGGAGSISFISGQATLTGDGTNAATVYQTITTSQNCLYKVAISAGSTGSLTYRAGGSVGSGSTYTVPLGATTNFEFRSLSSTTVYVQVYNTSITAATISQISVTSQGCRPTISGSIGDSMDGDANATKVITQYVGSGAENGISYYDLRFFGTALTADFIRIYLDSYSTIAASSGQTWTQSVYLRLANGSFSNVSLCGSSGSKMLDLMENNGPSSYTTVNDNFGGVSSLPTSAALSTQSYTNTATLSNVATVNIQPFILLCNATGAIDFTLRIGMPQLEQVASYSQSATSVIPTYGSAVTRAADIFTVPVTAAGASGAWYTQSIGTLGCSFVPPASGTAFYCADIDDGSGNNAIQSFQAQTTGDRFEMFSGGSFIYAGNGASHVAGVITKTAIAFQTNSTNAYYDANAIGLSTSITVPSGLTTLRVGAGRGGGIFGTGWINRLWYMPTRQSDTSLLQYTQ